MNMDEVKLTGLKDVVAWLECQPQWSGVAVRRVDDPPIPGEPFISMESAKLLVVSAVSIMDNRSFEAAARIEALEGALKDAQGVLMTRNQQIEELRDRLALLNETQSH